MITEKRRNERRVTDKRESVREKRREREKDECNGGHKSGQVTSGYSNNISIAKDISSPSSVSYTHIYLPCYFRCATLYNTVHSST